VIEVVKCPNCGNEIEGDVRVDGIMTRDKLRKCILKVDKITDLLEDAQIVESDEVAKERVEEARQLTKEMFTDGYISMDDYDGLSDELDAMRDAIAMPEAIDIHPLPPYEYKVEVIKAILRKCGCTVK